MERTENGPSDLEQLARKLMAERCAKMLVLFGSCTAIFDGRIKSYLPLGDRLLFVKKDETLVLHGSTGLKPLNWQLAGAGRINFTAEGGKLIVRSFRTKTKETMEISFETVYQTTFYDAHDSAKLSIYGSESDMSDYLFAHPEIIAKDFQPTTREFNTPFGYLDLRGVDKEGNIIIIEVKKRAATPADAHQLLRYKRYFEEVEEVKVRGILVAKSFSAKVMNVLQLAELEAVAVPWEEIFPPLAKEKPVTMDQFLGSEEEEKPNDH